MMDQKIIKFGLIVILVLGLAPLSFGQKNKNEVVIRKTEVKEISGEVSGISSNSISILYGQNEKTSFEMALTIDKDTKVEHKKSLKEIHTGDMVLVRYEETTETYKEKAEKGQMKDVTRRLGRLVKAVVFIKAAPKEL
jgi:hypothetical protein